MRRALLALLPLVVALTGCGEKGIEDSAGIPPRVDAPSELRPDGTVPWVDEPGGQREFDTPVPPRRPEAPGAQPCRAGDLRALLATWRPKLRRDDLGEVLSHEGLVGTVRVRSASRETCRLRGEVPTAMTVDGRNLRIELVHRIDEDGRKRVTVMRPGDVAELRLDWSSPFCGQASGRQVLWLELPEGGGRLRAPVAKSGQPPYSGATGRPQRASVLAAGGFDEPTGPTRDDSSLGVLRARLEPGRRAQPGERLIYHVILANPTDRPVALEPCPGYLQSRFSVATPGADDAVNDSQVYRLNCRPVRAVPANGQVRFEMAVTVPKALAGGRRLSVGLAPARSAARLPAVAPT